MGRERNCRAAGSRRAHQAGSHNRVSTKQPSWSSCPRSPKPAHGSTDPSVGRQTRARWRCLSCPTSAHGSQPPHRSAQPVCPWSYAPVWQPTAPLPRSLPGSTNSRPSGRTQPKHPQNQSSRTRSRERSPCPSSGQSQAQRSASKSSGRNAPRPAQRQPSPSPESRNESMRSRSCDLTASRCSGCAQESRCQHGSRRPCSRHKACARQPWAAARTGDSSPLESSTRRG